MTEDLLRLTILGCGSSGGVPRLGGEDGGGKWGACDPQNPKNRRRRCSLLVERIGARGVTRVLVDAGPDLRDQMLAARVGTLDAVLFTHEHADHTHGIDDLRQIVFNRRAMLDVWADARTAAILTARFDYVFAAPEGSEYPPILTLRGIEPRHFQAETPLVVEGAGGEVRARAFQARHGATSALGFRFGAAAYLPDANELPEATWPALEGLDLLIVDALRYAPHPSHANVETALGWIARAAPRRAVLTNMHVDLDYETLRAATPADVEPAFDGMVLELPAD